MKISKRRLRQIIKEEKARLEAEGAGPLNEQAKGAVSLGFAGFQPNTNPDFAKSYGKDARVVGRYLNNNTDLGMYGEIKPSMMEQPMPAPSSDPKENAFQELKMSGAFKELQEMMHDCSLRIEQWQNKHEVMLVDAGMEEEGVQLEDAKLALSDLRELAHQLR